MVKKYGHTGTLFIHSNGKYKWAYKFEHCIECKTVEAKHKGKGLCTRCHDKKRKLQGKKRKNNLKRYFWVHYYKNRVILFLNKKQKSKMGPVTFLTEEDKKQYKIDWYNKNKEVFSIINKGLVRHKRGFNCLEYNTKRKTIYFPFNNLGDKPKVCGSNDRNIRKEKNRQFNLVKNYYAK